MLESFGSAILSILPLRIYQFSWQCSTWLNGRFKGARISAEVSHWSLFFFASLWRGYCPGLNADKTTDIFLPFSYETFLRVVCITFFEPIGKISKNLISIRIIWDAIAWKNQFVNSRCKKNFILFIIEQNLLIFKFILEHGPTFCYLYCF